MSPARKKKAPARKATARKKPSRKPAAKTKVKKPAATKAPKATPPKKKKKAAKVGAAKVSAAKTKAPKAKAPARAKAAAKAAPARRAPTVRSARPRSRSRKRGAAASAPLFGSASQPAGAHAKLGVKYECFECGAKFYDLNRPEPLCPKCGTDQRTRPKSDPKAKPTPAPRRSRVDSGMSPLLEEEEVETPPAEQDALDLGLVESSDASFLGGDDDDEAEEDDSEES